MSDLVATREPERRIVVSWIARAAKRHWATALWALVWVAVAISVTDGILSPILLLSLVVLSVTRARETGGDADR